MELLKYEEELKNFLESSANEFATNNFQRVNSSKYATHRMVMKDEIVIEFDLDYDVMVHEFGVCVDKLKRDGYKFYIFDHKGKSPHLHIYNVAGLNHLGKDVRREYKKLFLKYYAGPLCDVSLAYPGHLIACEFKKHHRTNVFKSLVNVVNPLNTNMLVTDFLSKAEEETLRDYTDNFFEEDPQWFVSWMTNTKNPEGGIHNELFKNLAIVINNHGYDEEKVIDKLVRIYGRQADNQMRGWISWSRVPKSFNVGEIMNYMERHEINFNEVKNKWEVPILRV